MNPWDLSCRSKQPLGANCLLDNEKQQQQQHKQQKQQQQQKHRLFGHADILIGNNGGGRGRNFESATLVANALVAVDSNNDNDSQLNSYNINNNNNNSAISNGNNSDSSSNLSSGHALDKKARKKDQNRRAAYNYRRKKMEEKNRMREDEMRLVYSRVCLIGYAEELEDSIMFILNTKTRRILDNEGNAICFLCPICLQSCDNTMNLRNHLKAIHYSNLNH